MRLFTKQIYIWFSLTIVGCDTEKSVDKDFDVVPLEFNWVTVDLTRSLPRVTAGYRRGEIDLGPDELQYSKALELCQNVRITNLCYDGEGKSQSVQVHSDNVVTKSPNPRRLSSPQITEWTVRIRRSSPPTSCVVPISHVSHSHCEQSILVDPKCPSCHIDGLCPDLVKPGCKTSVKSC